MLTFIYDSPAVCDMQGTGNESPQLELDLSIARSGDLSTIIESELSSMCPYRNTSLLKTAWREVVLANHRKRKIQQTPMAISFLPVLQGKCINNPCPS